MSQIRRQVNNAVKNISKSNKEFDVLNAQADILQLMDDMNFDERIFVVSELNKVAERQSRNEHDMMRQSHAEYVLEQIAFRSHMQLRGF